MTIVTSLLDCCRVIFCDEVTMVSSLSFGVWASGGYFFAGNGRVAGL